MVYVAMIKKEIKFYYFLAFVMIVSIVVFEIAIFKPNYKKLENKYIPNYEKKYLELLNNYDFLKENYVFIPARVITLNNKKITNIFYIDKGKENNVLVNSYVVNSDGLVGIIQKVYDKFSIAKIISSSDINVAVEINDCYGTLKNIKNEMVVEDLINCQIVNPKDPVFTSKYSISSSNILIGYVKKVEKDKIIISNNLNPYKVKYVGVVYDSY